MRASTCNTNSDSVVYSVYRIPTHLTRSILGDEYGLLVQEHKKDQRVDSSINMRLGAKGSLDI